MRNANGMGGITKLKGKRRNPYWVRVTVGWDVTPTGKAKQLYKTLGYFSTRKEALLALAEYNTNPYNLADYTFAEVWEKWTPKHFEKNPSTRNGLITSFNYCTPIHNMSMKDIRTVHLQDIMDKLNGKSESSQTKVKTVMRNTFKWAMENDIIQKDYSEFVTIHVTKKEKKENFFTKEEVKKILDNREFIVPFGKAGMVDNLADSIIILLYTGMRIGELLELKCEDINLKERIIHVRGTKTKAADRLVPIHKELISILEKRIDSEYLFKNHKEQPIDYINYKRKFFDPYTKELKLDATPHATRHTFISRMDECGISSSSVTLKRIVGHSNSSVTEHYTHKEKEQLIEAIDKFSL